MNKVYLVYVHSCDGDIANETFEASVCDSLATAEKHLANIVKDFESEILPTYNEGEYTISRSSTYFWFSTECEDNNYYHVFIQDREVITSECYN